MRRGPFWQIVLGCILIVASTIVYIVHYVIFRDAHHIFIYLIGDIAFAFFDVFLVTLVLHQLLAYREKQALLKKVNMVIGAFFSEVGTRLLRQLSLFDPGMQNLAGELLINSRWSDKDFLESKRKIEQHDSSIECNAASLSDLKNFLTDKKPFLLALLENPNVLEHETFTNVLWAVFHLAEELSYRPAIVDLPPQDLKHLAGDIRRVYRLLIVEWLSYMRHLQRDYPYLFSLAVRTNPFDAQASIIVQ